MELKIDNLKRIALLSPVLCALVISNNAVAQNWYSNVPDIEVTLDTITGFEPTPIAVEDPTSQTGATLFPSDQSDLLEMARVIRNDLDFSPFCELVLIDSAYVRHLQLKEMNSQTWRRLGADYFVRLEAKITKQEISIRYEVTFTPSDRVSAKGRFASPRKYFRALAHTVSNDIMKKVFSENGIFRSQVCYVVRKGDVKDLYVADYDGAEATRILSNGSINLSPVFTPDGNEVLFTSYLDGFPKIYSFDLKRGKTKLIAGYDGLNTAPAVSPDGDRIACVLSKDGNAEIYLLDRRGRIIRRLTRTRAIENSPTFSPDGREIVFSSDRSGSPQIYIMDIEGLNVRRITYQGRYNDSPIWSPRGDLILFVGRTKSGRFDICTITPTGQDYTILTNNGANENPHFSPDGNNIIFSSTRLGFKEIFTMDRFGRRQRRLTHTGRADGSRDASNPSWSPSFNWGDG
ncbi:MAG: Tol-Pal system beta propeller repeat protein TolB [candidate division Zixibacteria bacterium]|nr:Tol-Pal system beta propeller repeat protein TolB [candidate division Zixibacteria bacterium]